MRILMIEDDAPLARSIAALLRAGGNAVDHVATGADALAVVAGERRVTAGPAADAPPTPA